MNGLPRKTSAQRSSTAQTNSPLGSDCFTMRETGEAVTTSPRALRRMTSSLIG